MMIREPPAGLAKAEGTTLPLHFDFILTVICHFPVLTIKTIMIREPPTVSARNYTATARSVKGYYRLPYTALHACTMYM